MNVVNSMTYSNQEEINNYINTFVEPYYYLSLDSSDIEKEIEIKKH